MPRLNHVRFTPHDISGYEFSWFKAMPSVIAAEISRQGVFHYHIAFETDACEKTIRNNIISTLRVPKVGRGQGNKYYSLEMDWKDINYIFKDGDIRHNSWCPEDSQEFRIKFGREKYGKKFGEIRKEESAESASVQIVYKEKEDRVWDSLLEKYSDHPDRGEFSLQYIKKLICCHYVNKGKAYPRHADLVRYAYGLYTRFRTEGIKAEDITPADLAKVFPQGCEYF